MANYYAQASILSATGETADTQTNVFAINHSGTLSSTDVDTWQTAITAFYEACKTAGAMKGTMRTGHFTKFLVATTSVPNYPLFTRDWEFTVNPAGIDLPQEVALCVSYASDSFPLVPRARRRGRIYVSGWGETQNENGRPTAGAMNGLAAAYGDYCEDLLAIPGVLPSVWSRTGNMCYPLDRCWCDNEWDTMRSRGGKSTARSTVDL